MPKLSRTAACRGCGAEIAFIKTVKGKTMPVDPEARFYIPEEDGQDVYVTADGRIARGREVDETHEGDIALGYISHWATCPESDRFRSGRRRD